jgi:hypothetical protein
VADVTGPISTLPGAVHAPHGMCDNHPDRPATVRVQGETDSFGCEMYDYCAECAKSDREEARQPIVGNCGWCDSREVELRPKRDYEEGMNGPVYYVCEQCRKRCDDRVAQELGDYDDLDD